MACSVALPCALVGTGARPLSGQLDKYAFRDNNGRLSGHTRTAMTHGFRDSTCKRFRVFTTHFFETKHSFQDNTTHKHTHTHTQSFQDNNIHMNRFQDNNITSTAFGTKAHTQLSGQRHYTTQLSEQQHTPRSGQTQTFGHGHKKKHRAEISGQTRTIVYEYA